MSYYLLGDKMDIEEYINKRHHHNNINENNKIKYLKNLLSRILISIIIVLTMGIFIKINDNNKQLINKYFFTDSLKFTKINNWYQNKIGKIIPDRNNSNYIKVFNNENIFNNNYEKYLNGIKLSLDKNTPVNILMGGLVVFIGEKDEYDNTLIIQGNDGIDYWYGGITNINVNLYDYLEKNTLIGEAKNDYLFLVLQKDGNYIDYESYIEKD